MISAELIFLVVMAGFVLLVCVRVYKSGERSNEAENAKEILESVAKAKKARDDLDINHAKSSRVRAKYRRK